GSPSWAVTACSTAFSRGQGVDMVTVVGVPSVRGTAAAVLPPGLPSGHGLVPRRGTPIIVYPQRTSADSDPDAGQLRGVRRIRGEAATANGRPWTNPQVTALARVDDQVCS